MTDTEDRQDRRQGIPGELVADFRRIVEEELAVLNEATVASYRLRPSEFEAWKAEIGTDPSD